MPFVPISAQLTSYPLLAKVDIMPCSHTSSLFSAIEFHFKKDGVSLTLRSSHQTSHESHDKT